jgi:cell division protein FtsA
MAAPLAASLVTLTKEQKMKGVVLANIGAETISIAIFENDVPISVKVFPVGSSDITSDIALSLKIPLQEAEQVKRGAITQTDVPRKKVDDAVAQRLKDMFNLIDAHLKSMHRQRLLPGGIVITGGGSGLATAKDIARATLRLPSQVGTTRLSAVDATWAVAFGLCRWGFTTDQRDAPGGLSDVLGRMWHTVVKGIRALLP